MESNTELQHLDAVLYQVASIGMYITDPWMPATCETVAEKLGVPLEAVRLCIQKLAADGLVTCDTKQSNGYVITRKGESSDAHQRACQDEAALRTECFGGSEEVWLKQIQERFNPY